MGSTWDLWSQNWIRNWGPEISVLTNTPGDSDAHWSLRGTALAHSLNYFHFYRRYFGEGNGTPLQHSCLENPMDRGAWCAAVHGVTKSWARLSDFTFAFHFHALEKEMATHSSVLAWRIPGTGEPSRLPSVGSHRVGHDWRDSAAAAAAAACSVCSFLVGEAGHKFLPLFGKKNNSPGW